MNFLPELIAVTTITVFACISPGPDFAVVAKNSIAYSRSVGVATALGISLGLSVHVVYSLIGIGFVISQSIVLFNTIKLLGALYLIYVGWQAMSAKPQVLDTSAVKSTHTISLQQAVRMGFFTNALNPKATVFFLGLFTQVISPATPVFVQIFYGLEIMVIAFIWFSAVASFLTHTVIRGRITGVQHYFERAMGALLIALGIKVAFSGSK